MPLPAWPPWLGTALCRVAVNRLADAAARGQRRSMLSQKPARLRVDKFPRECEASVAPSPPSPPSPPSHSPAVAAGVIQAPHQGADAAASAAQRRSNASSARSGMPISRSATTVRRT